MNKIYKIVVMACMINVLHADQQASSVFVSIDSDEEQASIHIVESCVDSDKTDWQSIKKDLEECKILKPLLAIFEFFQRALDEKQAELNDLKKQVEILKTHQNELQKKQAEDVDRQDKMYKSMQQSFFEQNRFTGG